MAIKKEYKRNAEGQAVEYKETDESGKVVYWRVKRGDQWVTLVERDQHPITTKDISQVTASDEGAGSMVSETYEGGTVVRRVTTEPDTTRRTMEEQGRPGVTRVVPVVATVETYDKETGARTRSVTGLKTSVSYHTDIMPASLRPIAYPKAQPQRPVTAGDVIRAAEQAAKEGVIMVETPYPKEWREQAHKEYAAMSPLDQYLFHFAAQGAKGVDYYAAALIPGGKTGQQVAEEAYIQNVISPRITGVKPKFLPFFTGGMARQPATWLAVGEGAGYVAGAAVKSVGTGIKAIPLVGEVLDVELIGPAKAALSTPIGQAAGLGIIYGPVAYRAVQSYTAFKASGYEAPHAAELATSQASLELVGAYGFSQGFQAGLKYGSPIKLGTFSVETPTGTQKSLLLYTNVGQEARVLGGVTATERPGVWLDKGYRMSFSLGAPSFEVASPALPFTPLEYELLKGPTGRYYAGRGSFEDYIKWELGAQLTRGFGSPDFGPKMKFEDVLRQTKYVEKSAPGLSRYLESHPDLMVYGSTVQKMYMGEDFPRQLADVDIQQVPNIRGLSTETHVQNLYTIMKADYGANVRISSETPTLIEVKVAGQWHHGIDFHPIDASAGYSPGQQEFIGLGIRPRAPQTTENVLMMQFPEQVQRKGVSITTPGPEGVGPEPHRIKDVGDFIAGYEFTLGAYPNPAKAAQLETFKAAWGVEGTPEASPNLFSYSPASLPGPAGLSPSGGAAPMLLVFSSPAPSPSPRPSVSLPISTGLSPSASPSISASLSLPISPSASLSPSPSMSLPVFSPSPSRSPSRSLSPSLASPSRSPSRSLSPSISAPSPSPSPSPSPPVFTTKSPPFGFDFDFKQPKQNKKGFFGSPLKTRYKPSFGAEIFNIHGKMPKFLTGLEVRPLL